MSVSRSRTLPALAFSLIAAAGALALDARPAQAHSNAECKFEALQACLDMQGTHHLCVEYAITLCAGHSHGSGSGSKSAGTAYQNPGHGGTWTRMRRTLVQPVPRQPSFGFGGSQRFGGGMGMGRSGGPRRF